MRQKTYSDIRIQELSPKIDLNSAILLVGSCFSENISDRLESRKFTVLSNPAGILFDTLSIERTLQDISLKRQYSEHDLFYQNELYTSWSHHSDFSSSNRDKTIENINQTIERSHSFLQKTNTVILTLGSAFSYYHLGEKTYVANCHKVPQTEFRKDLIGIDQLLQSLKNIRNSILSINPNCRLILTISPVRHLRDGLIENNRSKARLIEAVNLFCQEYTDIYYFPAYEIVIDVLRDYRYFDIDFAHPNYLATDLVFEYFKEACINMADFDSMNDFYHLSVAMKHRSRNPETNAHYLFLKSHYLKAIEFQEKFPLHDFSREINYFLISMESHPNHQK